MKLIVFFIALLILNIGEKPKYKFYILTNNPQCSQCVEELGSFFNRNKTIPILSYYYETRVSTNIEKKNELNKFYTDKFDFFLDSPLPLTKEYSNLKHPRIMRISYLGDTVFFDYDKIYVSDNPTNKTWKSLFFK